MSIKKEDAHTHDVRVKEHDTNASEGTRSKDQNASEGRRYEHTHAYLYLLS